MTKAYALIGHADATFENPAVSKFYAVLAACAVFAPLAMAALNQALKIAA